MKLFFNIPIDLAIFIEMKKTFFFLILLIHLSLNAQSYSSAITGDTSNFLVAPEKKICLMGGATEDDNAIAWWLNGAKGGDVVIIRVSGSLSSYNTYFTSSTFTANLNSVETILIPSIAAANHPYVKRRLREAEAIWIAGGNQNFYRNYWKNTFVDSAINWAYNTKGTCIGGTSAGMMIQSQYYYYAGNGSVTSANALANPFNTDMTIAYNDFLNIPYLQNVITDTHFDNPDRKGRMMAFLARNSSTTNRPLGIACDEYTAVCIDSTGLARAFGGAPNYSDNAYFLQVNCQTPNTPEVLSAGLPLTFNRSNMAVKVYHIDANASGSQTFDLKNWQTASGGTWENWYVQSGVFASTLNASTSACVLSSKTIQIADIPNQFYVNRAQNVLCLKGNKQILRLTILDAMGQKCIEIPNLDGLKTIDISTLKTGIYIVLADDLNNRFKQKIVIE